MKAGDRVRLKANLYDTMSDDDMMAPGSEGVLKSFVGSNCYIIVLDKQVDDKFDWAFVAGEFEVIDV
jgi:hypothetical protein